jgi:hypothetical protein
MPILSKLASELGPAAVAGDEIPSGDGEIAGAAADVLRAGSLAKVGLAIAGGATSSFLCSGLAGLARGWGKSFSGTETEIDADAGEDGCGTGNTDSSAGDATWGCAWDFAANRSPKWISMSPN